MLLGLLAAILPMPASPEAFQPVEDTYIDSQLPESNFGRDGLLLGGPGTAVLMRFPELNWMAPGREPSTAILTLHLVEPADVKLKSVSRVLVPWSEGGELRLPVARPPLPDINFRGGASWNHRRYGVMGQKWNTAGAASSEDAVPIQGVTVVTEGGKVVIAGLGPAVAEMANDPLHNYGLRLEFESKVAFFSGEGYGPGPKLDVTTKNVERHGAALAVLSLEPKTGGNGWVAKVQNVGDAVATGMSATWRVRDEKKGASDTQQALAPGDIASIEWSGSTAGEKGLPDVDSVSVEILPGGSGGIAIPESGLSVPLNGLAVKFDWTPESQSVLDVARGSEPVLSFLQRFVNDFNLGVLAQSRASFAPEGCYERVRIVTGDEPALRVTFDLKSVSSDKLFSAFSGQLVKAMSPYGGHWTTPPESPVVHSDSLGWLPDTRDDSAWPFAMMLPNYPWGDPKALQPPLVARGLLSRAELAAINSLVGKLLADRATYVPLMPDAAILSVADAGGNPLIGAEVEVFPTQDGKLTTEAAYKGVTTPGGNLFMGQRNGKGPFGDLKPDGSNGWLFVRVTREFVTESIWLPAWQLAVEKARGSGNVPFVELRLMIASGAIKTDEDLAHGKSVSDSLERYPAELNAVVDENPQSSLAVTPGEKPYWLEIDLGRDRLIGAVEIETDGKPMEKFEIATYKTGQKPEAAVTWIREGSGSLRLLERGKDVGGRNVVSYTSSAVRSRFVRILFRAGSEVKISAIRVRTLQQGS